MSVANIILFNTFCYFLILSISGIITPHEQLFGNNERNLTAMKQTEIELFNIIRGHSDPAEALLKAVEIFTCLKQLEASEEPSVASLQESA